MSFWGIQFCREEYDLRVRKLAFLGDMFLADAFIQVTNLMVKVGVRTILRIFFFVMDHAVFTVVQKHSEKEFLEGAKNCYIWRLRIPFNHDNNPRNYLQKLLNYTSLLDAENSISHINEYVKSCIDSFVNNCEPGIYNFTNVGSITTRQVVDWMREEGVTDKVFNFFENEADFMQKAAVAPPVKLCF